MKKVALFLLFMAPLGAQAQLLVQKGARVRLDVEYTFASAGRYESSSKDQTRVWDSRKTVTMNAIYSADAPQAFGALHADDPGHSARSWWSACSATSGMCSTPSPRAPRAICRRTLPPGRSSSRYACCAPAAVR